MARLRIEVVYALAGAQDTVRLELAPGTNAEVAVAASGLLEQHGLAGTGWVYGLAGRRIPPDQQLHDGDRLELLRPLALDPKEARRARVRRKRHI